MSKSILDVDNDVKNGRTGTLIDIDKTKSNTLIDIDPETQKKLDNAGKRIRDDVEKASEYLLNTTPKDMVKDAEIKGKSIVNYLTNTKPKDVIQDIKNKGQ